MAWRGRGGLLQESDSEAHPATCQPAGRHLWGPVPWEGGPPRLTNDLGTWARWEGTSKFTGAHHGWGA